MEYMVLWGKGRGTIVEGTKIGDGGGKRKRRDTYVFFFNGKAMY